MTIVKKRSWSAALGLFLGIAFVGKAGAVISSTDSCTVTITPSAAYLVQITTGNTNLNMGSVNLNTTTQTVTASTVTVLSSYAYTGLKLQGAMYATGTPWTFSANTAVATIDQLQTWVVFTDTSVNTTPAQDTHHFVGTVPGAAGSNVVDATSRIVGTTGGACPGIGAAGNLFTETPNTTAGYKSMECMPANAADANGSVAYMWMFFKLPPATTDLTPKLVSFILYAAAPN